MFSLDPYIIKFVAGNVIAITLFLALLKGIAKMIPGVLDDKIVSMLQGLFRLVPKPDKTQKGNILVSLLALIFLFTFLGAGLAGCSFGVKKSLLVTQKTFNEMVTDYRVYYKATSPEEQADLEKNVHPKIIDALKLLTGINEAVRLGIEPSQIDKERFRELRFELYSKLPNIFPKMEGTQ